MRDIDCSGTHVLVRGPRVGDSLPGDPGSILPSDDLDGDGVTPVLAI